MSAPSDITVIGAGIVGMSCARWLQRDGHAVTVIDPVPAGEACSGGNAGIIAMSSVLPLATPGMMRKVPGWLLDPLGPLTVRWRYLPRIAPWVARLLAASRKHRIPAIADALRALNAPTLDAYRELLGPADFASLIRCDGLIYAYPTERALDADSWTWEMRRARGVRAERIGREELRQLEPALGPGAACAMFVEDSAHSIDPETLVKTLARRFADDGGEIVAARVRDVEPGPDGPRAIILDQGRREVSRLVVAAGAWSRPLAARLGSRVPLETERGYHLTLPDPGVTLRRPVALTGRGFIVTPMSMGLRIAGTVEFGGLDAPPDYRRADVLFRHARHIFPGLRDEGATRWMGFRPSIPDSLPVISSSPEVPGVFYAFGHGHLGLTEGAMTGRLVAELAAGRETSIDVSPYRVDRF
jgi:D-amino-acid dehydrogenase